MRHLEIFVRLVTVCGVAIGFVLSHEADPWLSKLNISGWALNLLALLIVVVTAEVLKEGAELAVNSPQWLRRVILRHQFVEGSWLDVAFNKGVPYSVGITRIEPDGTCV